MAKVDAWMAQREEIARELRQVADRMLSGDNPFRTSTGRDGSSMARLAGNTPSATAPSGRARGRKAKTRRTMSAEAREKIAAAQRARWAKQKGEPAAAPKGGRHAKAAK